jgi:hypothetical protein
MAQAGESVGLYITMEIVPPSYLKIDDVHTMVWFFCLSIGIFKSGFSKDGFLPQGSSVWKI